MMFSSDRQMLLFSVVRTSTGLICWIAHVIIRRDSEGRLKVDARMRYVITVDSDFYIAAACTSAGFLPKASYGAGGNDSIQESLEGAPLPSA